MGNAPAKATPSCALNTPRGRPRIVSDDDRRTQLLCAAETVFLTAGYHAATVNDVARAAGMSKRTVYQVVASKAALFEALITDRFLPITIPPEDDGRPLQDRLVDVLTRMAGFCLAPRQLAIVRLMIAEAPQSRDMADALDRLGIGRGNGILDLWVEAQRRLGLFRPDLPAGAASALFFAAVGEAHLHSLLSLGDPPASDLIDARIRYAVRIFLTDALSPAPNLISHPISKPVMNSET